VFFDCLGQNVDSGIHHSSEYEVIFRGISVKLPELFS
jgi:hypothetical protein